MRKVRDPLSISDSVKNAERLRGCVWSAASARQEKDVSAAGYACISIVSA